MSNEALIAEARRLENDYGDAYEVAAVMSELADALEAAERDKREAQAEAWAEGFNAGELDYLNHVTFDEPCIPNPYLNGDNK